MPRPHEPFADALRTAREIVSDGVGPLTQAAARSDPRAYDAACDALVQRIAQALADASEAAVARTCPRDDEAA